MTDDLRPGAGVLVILPTYNERENLELATGAVHGVLPDADILVVDDGSPDGTGDLADALATADPRVHVLHREVKAGLGRAYVAGFRWALDRAYARIVQMDADLSHDAQVLPALIAGTEEAAMALGSRYVTGGGTEGWGLIRKLVSRGGSLYAGLVLGVKVKDLTGGFKCFRRETLAGLPLDDLLLAGYGFQIEMTYRVLGQGGAVVEVPIVFRDRQKGISKMSSAIFFEALTGVWRVRRRLPRP